MIEESYKVRNKAVPLVVYCQEDNRDTNIHNHSDFEIIHVKSGCGVLQINDQKYRIEAGDLVCINPMEVHALTVEQSIPFSHACICFDCGLILDEKLAEDLKKEDIRINHLIKKQDMGCGELAKLVMQIVKCDEENGPYMKMEITSYVSLLFAQLMKYEYVNHSKKDSKGAVFCARVLQYISEHYKEQITSGEAAQALSYNQSYFCRTFRKNFNACFSEYLNRYRVTVARIMMEEGGRSIAQIASACGFMTPAHFSLCFKKYVGLLPSEYKKGRRGNNQKVNTDK